MDDFSFNAERLWRICVRCAFSIYRGVEPPALAYAKNVAAMLFEIAAQESSLRWERQRSPRWDGAVGGFSKWQMERSWLANALHALSKDPALARRVVDFSFADPKCPTHFLTDMPLDTLTVALRFDDNDKVAAALCRVGMLAWPQTIPETVEGRAALWKKKYNTPLGKGTVTEYLENARRWCRPVMDRHPAEEFLQ
jgi:hypothetical protein